MQAVKEILGIFFDERDTDGTGFLEEAELARWAYEFKTENNWSPGLSLSQE